MFVKGDGTFVAAGHPIGSYIESMALGDLDGDGRLDLVTQHEASGLVIMSLGRADGAFARGVEYVGGDGAVAGSPPPFTGASIALGDLNGDGRPDLVAASNISANVTVLLNACTHK